MTAEMHCVPFKCLLVSRKHLIPNWVGIVLDDLRLLLGS